MSAMFPIMNSLPMLDNFECLDWLLSLNDEPRAIHLLDDQGELLINTEEDFVKLLKIKPSHKVKVVSIVGNVREGKSYTLNHTFFDGKEIFKTSPFQHSGTLGVWAKYDPTLNMICIDTEGYSSVMNEEHQQTYLLLKIFAISDVVIYRTKSEYLPCFMYRFLGGASRALKEYFNFALQNVSKNCEIQKNTLPKGPSLIIFHETGFTKTLNSIADVEASAEDILRKNFARLNEPCDEFGSLCYIGVTEGNNETCFKQLRLAVKSELKCTQVRTPRNPNYVYNTLKVFDEKFQNQENDAASQLHLSAFFTCQDKCQSCGIGCSLSMGHQDDYEQPHFNASKCKFQHEYQNFVYLCKKCFNNEVKQIVKPTYQEHHEQSWSNMLSTAWSGYIIKCPTHGKIYQSRAYWYDNKDPKDEAVVTESTHVWSGDKSLCDSQNSAQNVLDAVTTVSNVVTSFGSQQRKVISDWITDKIAPSYWKPNKHILECAKCKIVFGYNTTKHHCRACGQGFCEVCSSKTQPVPERGWYEDVRVCDYCYREEQPTLDDVADSTEIRNRRIGERVINSISVVKSLFFDKPKEVIKDMARPAYWTPDNECRNCAICNQEFGTFVGLHHCRDCGKGTCDQCSSTRKPVLHRGWGMPVRVCDKCCNQMTSPK